MRKKRWIAPVFGMLATAAFGQSASAQALVPPPPAGARPVAPGPTAYAGRPTYTPVAPDPASRAGWPPNMEAWPTISPFEHAFEQTYNDHGIWFRDVRNQSRTYQVNVQFISADFKDASSAPVGYSSVIGYTGKFYGEAQNGTEPLSIFTVKDAVPVYLKGRYIGSDGLGDLEVPAQTGIPPRPVTVAYESTQVPTGGDDSDGTTLDFTFARRRGGLLQIVNFDGGTPDEDIDPETEIAKTVLYPVSGQVLSDDATLRFGGLPETVGQQKQNPRSPGLRISLGLENEDESGFLWSGFWVNGQSDVFRRGFDDPRHPVLTNIVLFAAPNLGTQNLNGLPDAQLSMANKTPVVLALDYNTLFQVEFETQALGTDLAFYTTPVVDWGWFRMRPLWGARYNYIRETFQFTGRDNGFAYAFDTDGDTFTDVDAGTGNNNGTTPLLPPTGNVGLRGDPVLSSDQIPITVTDPIILTPIFPYETTALSTVRSHLYGPQVGLDMQAGGEHLMITATTKTGVLVDTERLSLDTAGFGSQEALTGVRPTSNDDKTHSRIVPFIEFNTNADFNVFPIIPIVNRWQFLENARIRAGWSTLVVGNLQRPLNQIAWRTHASGGPHIQEDDRDTWYMTYWNVGIHWTF